MADLQKVEEFDSEALKNLKMSLLCTICKRPPRPDGEKLYMCQTCDDIRCHIHRNSFCLHRKVSTIDKRLAKFVESIKLYNCLYLKNGCLMEFEAKELEAHERICFSRDVDCPKHECGEKIAFNGIMDHYQEKHSDLKMKGNILHFKGSLEDLAKSTFILKCHGRLFYPQFRMKDKQSLHIWVIGHGNQN